MNAKVIVRKNLSSPFRGWLGGKYRLAKHIITRLPEHHCYAEPFAGGAWVLFKKPMSKCEAINDINQDVINVYRCLQNHPVELMRQLQGFVASRDEYERQRLVNPITLTDIQRAARYVYLHRCSFGGKITSISFGIGKTRPPKFNADKLIKELRHSHKRLQGIYIECLNYDEFIKRYDGDNTFFYIDPPYWNCETDYGKDVFDKTDFEALAAQLKVIKGKFLLSINDTKEIREIFSSFKLEEVKLNYSVSKKGTTKANELFVTNY